MKFSISSSELQKNLGHIIGVVPTRSTLPILENFLFNISGDSLSITATDLDVTITACMKVVASGEGKIAVPAKKLLETIRALPDTTVNFTIDVSTMKIEMKTENGEYKLTGESSEGYPTIPSIKKTNELTIDNEVLRRLINKTSFAVSSDELRPALTGILFQLKKNEIRSVATDGHRLVKIASTSLLEDVPEFDVIIIAKALSTVSKCLEGNTSNIIFDDGYAQFNLGNITLTSRTIVEKYPNYESVLPIDNDKKLVVDRNKLISSVRRTSLYASSSTHQVRFALKKNQLTVFAEDIDFGTEAKEVLPCKYGDEAMEVCFNYLYIIDILTHIDTEEVEFAFSTPNRAVIVRPLIQRENEDLLMLIMPVRLNT